ncbi:MAG: type II secretion system protein [Candidatus Paceibacterota bacterium]
MHHYKYQVKNKGLARRSTTEGFTLIELLVVVSIISLLSSIVFVSVNAAKLKGRNAARLSAVHTLINGFNISLGSGGSFPVSGYACVSATCYDGWVGYTADATVNAFLVSGLPNKPVDPKGGSRGYGGFLYINPITFSGNTGAFIDFMIETPGSCGSATVSSTTANYTDCYQYLGP